MASLKKELDEYLSAKDKSSVEINIPFKLNALPLERWYKSKGSGTTTNGLDSAVQSSWFPAMSRLQRLIAFCVFICLGIFCFTVASFYIPVLIFKARKFALLYTLGSFFMVCSFVVLWGPMACVQQMFSTERLPFTSAYLGTLLATLYSALSLQSTFLTCISASGQETTPIL
ncbi:protein transport protein sft2 isoform X2 [Ischnura elegans]|uniref:protein transport protein sft2 isoform X2 n=1 Tax=Ischnura elegans TaxID=197161 RepID=UPI001ED8BFBC|nr:protein transport protein sft2 isoform X2 [Ischnura elegans]